MKSFTFFMLVLVLAWGCARVRVEAPKEAIKVDVSMRLDIYQHVEKDIDTIENMVSAKDKHSLLEFLVTNAYADDLGADVQQAIERRKNRKSDLNALEGKGAIGENRSGMAEVKSSVGGAQALVQAENSDRAVIYNGLAAKNGSSLEDVQRLYAKRLQSDAPGGTPIETDAGWQTK